MQQSTDREPERKIHQEYRNRLADEKSPYLLQHADNPVAWFPWGDEAFDQATVEDKPIFLSIGYSTCHWCHVMAHESFEDPEVARLLNEMFVSIKVDREERPDIDSIYMTVCQMMTGSGGWPLTVFMTPDRRPFFTGTYFPRENRFGRMGMLDLLPRIGMIWQKDRSTLLEAAEEVTGRLRTITAREPGREPNVSFFQNAFQHLNSSFDEHYAGFGSAPKFPTPHTIMFLLRFWKRHDDKRALEMAARTAMAMRQGGIYDQIGFGIHRYSTDERWLVPHFEKMLYDQALFANATIELYQATGDTKFAEIVHEVFSYVFRDLMSAEGAFYSAEDADSDDKEGAFYVWHLDEIRDALSAEDTAVAQAAFGVTEEGNFKDEVTGMRSGANILHLQDTRENIARQFRLTEAELKKKLEGIRQRLITVREKRNRPHRDEKILLDWNGLMIASLAKGGRVLDRADYVSAAERAATFLLKKMASDDGRLFHRYGKGEAGIAGTLDDYAFFVWGLIELYRSTFNAEYLRAAMTINQQQLAHFWDETAGGFFFTPDDGESLLVRQIELYDGALPSGNSVSIMNLLHLSRLSGDIELENRADELARLFSPAVQSAPGGFAFYLSALDYALGEPKEVILVGSPSNTATREMLGAMRKRFLPSTLIVVHDPDEKEAEDSGLSENHRSRPQMDGETTAYVCREQSCSLPTNDVRRLLVLLGDEAGTN